MPRVIILVALTLAVSACGAEKKAEGAGTATGEILPGSVSDAMLPLDSVRSQAPLAPKTEAAAKNGAVKAEASDAPTVGAPAADADPSEAAREPAEG